MVAPVDLLGRKRSNSTCFVLLLLFMMASCQWTKKAKQTPSTDEAPVGMVLESIECQKLSEQLIKMGSGNDEIALLVFLRNEKEELQILWYSNIIIFKREGEKHPIQEAIKLKPEQVAGELVFVLIEQDTERTISDLIAIAQKQLSESLAEERLRELLEDDDLLGIQRRKFQSNRAEAHLRFWGLHLFDEYEYWVHWKLEYL